MAAQSFRFLTSVSSIVLLGLISVTGKLYAADGFVIQEAKCISEINRLEVTGTGTRRQTVTLTNSATDFVLGSDRVSRVDWLVRNDAPETVPCRVRATQSNGEVNERNVVNAPADCDDGGVVLPPPPPPNGGAVSINSTSQNGPANISVPQQPLLGQAGYSVFAINDLGMHCGDFDTRISSILPPFNVFMHRLFVKVLRLIFLARPMELVWCILHPLILMTLYLPV